MGDFRNSTSERGHGVVRRAHRREAKGTSAVEVADGREPTDRLEADRGDLHGADLPRPDPDEGSSGTSPVEERGVRLTDHVHRIGWVLHPEGDADVGIGPDRVTDRPRRPLGGENEVQSKCSTPLGQRYE